jgi:CHASE2 domain-containing sensor protein
VRYQNLDLWVEREASGSYLIQGKSTQGDFRDHAAMDLATIVIDREKMASGGVTGPDLEALGQQLYDFLFKTGDDGKLGTLLDRSLGAVTQVEQGLRLRLQLDEGNPDVAAMPWEFLRRRLDKRFMACQALTPVVRFLEVPIPLRRMEATLPLSVLVVIPQVEGLAVELEVSQIEQALAPMKSAARMKVLQNIVTPETLRAELARQSYDVLHFIGHGDFDGKRGTLRFNDDAGKPLPVDHETLGRLVANETTLRLVVLNSCKGAALSATDAFVGMAPRLVEAGVPAVVAMQYPITEQEAQCFVNAFYGSLFDGQDRGSVDAAICQSRAALELKFAGTRAFAVPAVFMRYNEGILFRVVTDSALRNALASPHDAARDQGIIREIEANARRIAAGGVTTSAEHRTQLLGLSDELARAKRRVRLRAISIVAGSAVALLASLAFAINLLDRLPLTWVVAASPVWFGDPRGRSLTFADSIEFTTATLDSAERLRQRPRYAALVDKLSEAGARIVVFDIFFRTPQPDEDPTLAVAFARAEARGTSVVFGAVDLRQGHPNVVPSLAATASVGGVCLGENAALFPGVVPLFTWGGQSDSGFVPSLALAAAAAWRRARIVVDTRRVGVSLVDDAGRVIDQVRPTRERYITVASKGCPLAEAGSHYAELLAMRVPTRTWREPARQHDLFAVVQSEPAQMAWARGKAVLVGMFVPEEKSIRRTGFRTDERYGVERHADALATILSDAEVLPLGGVAQLLVIGVGSAIGTWTAFRSMRGRRRRDLAIAGGAIVALFLLATIAYRTAGRLVDILYPSIALGLSYGIILVLKWRWRA